MLRILSKRQSINVRKVLWTCDEIGVRYQQEEFGAGTRSTSKAKFLVLNPKALVPVLIDGDAVLTGSNTIVRYIAAKCDGSDLLPTEPLARARVEELMDWQATEFNAAWRVAFLAIVRKTPNTGSPDQIRQSLAD
jgi:glutathione S-transferase